MENVFKKLLLIDDDIRLQRSFICEHISMCVYVVQMDEKWCE